MDNDLDTATTTPTIRRPPFDPELAIALSAMAEVLPASITVDDIESVRSILSSDPNFEPSLEMLRERADIEELAVPGPAGAPDIGVLVLRPKGATTLLPGMYHTHGGGMIMGSNRTGLTTMLDMMDEIPMVVVSVEYRLAPEHPHPAPTEDCYAGLEWTAAHLSELGIAPDRLLVGGMSAGGGLAAAMALMARDRGGPALAGQVLMCPMLDDREITASSTILAGEGVWDRVSNRTGWSALLGDACAGPDVSSYAAPARAEDLSNLPPAYIDVGSVETFRDEDIEYANRIWQAGGSAELHVWAGGFHGFELVPTAGLSQASIAARMTWLHRILGV